MINHHQKQGKSLDKKKESNHQNREILYVPEEKQHAFLYRKKKSMTALTKTIIS